MKIEEVEGYWDYDSRSGDMSCLDQGKIGNIIYHRGDNGLTSVTGGSGDIQPICFRIRHYDLSLKEIILSKEELERRIIKEYIRRLRRR